MNDRFPQMDWQQVVLNGGPPCFALLDDEQGWFCGRAERWEGHDGDHKFVSLEQLVQQAIKDEREQCAARLDKQADTLRRAAHVVQQPTEEALRVAELAIQQLNQMAWAIRHSDTQEGS